MIDFLQTLMSERRQDVRIASRNVSLETLRTQASGNVRHRRLTDQWRRGQDTDRRPYIIAEVKKASLSAGLLCRDYHPAVIALDYEKAGAAGISVLTEPRHFLGSDNDLREVRRAVRLPVLRKDFIGEPYQIYESAVLGADMVLLITAALDFHLLRDLYTLATGIGLDVLVEVHTPEELERAVPLTNAILGVNNRDLATLKTDLSVARRLAPLLPPDRLCIAESGIKTRRDIEELQSLGYQGFLIGESLMRSADVGAQLRSFLTADGPDSADPITRC